MLYSFFADLISPEFKYSECLFEIDNTCLNKKKIGVDRFTLFCNRTVARCCISLSLIPLRFRSSLVTICIE